MLLIEDDFIKYWKVRKSNISLSDINNYRILYNIILNNLEKTINENKK